jgi:hypothetical protein
VELSPLSFFAASHDDRGAQDGGAHAYSVVLARPFLDFGFVGLDGNGSLDL